jgi:hypothetical protein
MSERGRAGLWLALLLAAALVLQVFAGAYRTETGNYSDESAHFMNGLVLRDYLTSGLTQNPLTFAKDYYLHYPKIAPLAWPPLFHVALGLFLVPGWAPHPAALVLVSIIVAWTGWRLYRVSLMVSGRAAALVVCALFVSTPMVIDISSAVMADGLVGACALEAMYWLALFFNDARRRHAVLFGFFAAMSCLSKGNGIAVLLLPPILLILTRRFSLLRQSGLYLAALMVLALAAPFLVISYRFDAGIGDFERVTTSVAWMRLQFYSAVFYREFSALLLAVMCIGAAATVFRRHEGSATLRSVLPASLTSLVAASLLFHLMNPHSALAARYMSMAIAPLLALVPIGVRLLLQAIPGSAQRQRIGTGLLIALAAVFLSTRPASAQRQPGGWRDVVDFLETGDQLAGRRIAVISDESGEGALVSEVAGRQPSPTAAVIRGTKLLASDDWNGHNFRLIFSSSHAIMQELEDLHVDFLVFDRSRQAENLGHWSQVNQMIMEYGSRIEEVYSVRGKRRPIVVYKMLYRSPGREKRLRIVSSSGEVIAER